MGETGKNTDVFIQRIITAQDLILADGHSRNTVLGALIKKIIKALKPENQQNLLEDMFQKGTPEPFGREGTEAKAKNMVARRCKILEYEEAKKDPQWETWFSNDISEELRQWIRDTGYNENRDIFFIKDTGTSTNGKPSFVFFDNRNPTRQELRGETLKKSLRDKIKGAADGDTLFTILRTISQEHNLASLFIYGTPPIREWLGTEKGIPSPIAYNMENLIINSLTKVYHDCRDSESQQKPEAEVLLESLESEFKKTVSQQTKRLIKSGLSKTLLWIIETAKTLPESLAESLSRSTAALLNHLTPQNAILLEAIVPVYTEQASFYSMKDAKKDPNANSLEQVRKATETFFTSSETMKIEGRYSRFKKEIERTKNELGTKSNFTEKLRLCMKRLTQFLLVFVGLAPEVRHMSFFKTPTEKRFHRLAYIMDHARRTKATPDSPEQIEKPHPEESLTPKGPGVATAA